MRPAGVRAGSDLLSASLTAFLWSVCPLPQGFRKSRLRPLIRFKWSEFYHVLVLC